MAERETVGGEAQRAEDAPAVVDPDARLRAVVEIAQAMAAAQSPLEAVRAAAGRARGALGAAMSAVSVWDRESGRLRVLVNHGDLAPGEEPLPEDESYPVADFPEIVSFLDAQRRLPRAWVQTADDGEAGPPAGVPPRGAAFSRQRAAALRRRGRSSCLVAPIVLHGRAWGELYLARGLGSPVFTAGDTDFATLVAAQISAGLAQTERLEDLRRLAFTDPLTGLANRRAVDGRLDAALEAHRREGVVVSLVVCDVNGLKRINDVHGHEVGDRLLERFASLLSLCGARLPGSIAARLGGDEFCLLAEGQSADEVVRVAEELCTRALELGEGEGVACGVASTGDPIGPVTTADRLFRLADAAQYRAKAARAAEPVVAGRGRSPDAVVQLADSAERSGRGGRARRPDRRRFRGALHSADPAQLIPAVLAVLDAGHTVEGQPVRVAHPADTAGRLAAVAETAARMLDAVAWWTSYVPPGSRRMRTVRYSVHRMTRGPAGAGAQAQRALNEAPDAVFDLRSYPLTERAVRGDAFALRTGSPGNDPAEEAVLVVGGYRGMVAAGGSNAAGGWLVELFADEATLPLAGVAPVLRALVAVALSGPASPPD
ncbi:sensor domain-containing diguanylate cyclase [Streptacidiphilus sp. ASG 303]|uniref:GGDEF domain-containing protein n=1 Tax=Streptacidiphilus sp. ASG 303 TaxID=2896847 RepID=UPI001E375410|nr:sensor domain-containing diguanylate cyclase [Streptacidiphilus sp. ASG 303]MCD0481824.1 sensor domain-containing diguanylate cyclase [Streptacidiphilus sp. ASG 303]